MKLETINKKKQDKRNKNLELVKSIITKHHTKSIKKIQGFLVEEHKIAISARTIKRYMATIKKVEQKKISKKIKKPKIKTEIPDGYVFDPSNKKWKLPLGNSILEIQWGNQGLIYYDKINGVWKYSSNHKVFDKNKKSQKFYKIHGVSWNFDDL